MPWKWKTALWDCIVAPIHHFYPWCVCRQVVWKDSTQMGCARSSCSTTVNGLVRQYTYVVCREFCFCFDVCWEKGWLQALVKLVEGNRAVLYVWIEMWVEVLFHVLYPLYKYGILRMMCLWHSNNGTSVLSEMCFEATLDMYVRPNWQLPKYFVWYDNVPLHLGGIIFGLKYTLKCTCSLACCTHLHVTRWTISSPLHVFPIGILEFYRNDRHISDIPLTQVVCYLGLFQIQVILHRGMFLNYTNKTCRRKRFPVIQVRERLISYADVVKLFMLPQPQPQQHWAVSYSRLSCLAWIICSNRFRDLELLCPGIRDYPVGCCPTRTIVAGSWDSKAHHQNSHKRGTTGEAESLFL